MVKPYKVLRSAVGMTHGLRSDLWWTIHLSSEAQCVSHHLPLVDCHTQYSIIKIKWTGKNKEEKEKKKDNPYKPNKAMASPLA